MKRVMLVAMLLLSSASAVLWVRSHYVTDVFSYGGLREHDRESWMMSVESWRGGVEIEYNCWTYYRYHRGPTYSEWKSKQPTGLAHAQFDAPDHSHQHVFNDEGVYWQGAGFAWDYYYFPRGIWGNIALTVPFWFLLLLTGVFPAIVGFRYVRRRRREGRGFPVEVSVGQTGGGEGSLKSG